MCDQLPPGGFAVKTTRTHVLIVGNGTGMAQAVDAFLAHFVPPIPEGVGTDLIIAPVFLSGRREDDPGLH